MQNFSEESGDITKHIPKETREIAFSLALVIDAPDKAKAIKLTDKLPVCEGKIDS